MIYFFKWYMETRKDTNNGFCKKKPWSAFFRNNWNHVVGTICSKICRSGNWRDVFEQCYIVIQEMYFMFPENRKQGWNEGMGAADCNIANSNMQWCDFTLRTREHTWTVKQFSFWLVLSVHLHTVSKRRGVPCKKPNNQLFRLMVWSLRVSWKVCCWMRNSWTLIERYRASSRCDLNTFGVNQERVPYEICIYFF